MELFIEACCNVMPIREKASVYSPKGYGHREGI